MRSSDLYRTFPLVPLAERLSTPGFFGAIAGVVGLPLVAAALVDGPLQVAAGGLAVVGAIVSGGLGWQRRRSATLPLVAASVGLRGRVDGQVAYRFRVRLGHGRTMRNARAEVVFRAADGDEVALPPLMANAKALVGPWTVAVLDRDGRCDRPGTFVLRVWAEENGRTWDMVAPFPQGEMRDGRFGPGVRLVRDKLCWDQDRWDQVHVEAEDATL
jgi:hypothetical protein